MILLNIEKNRRTNNFAGIKKYLIGKTLNHAISHFRM